MDKASAAKTKPRSQAKAKTKKFSATLKAENLANLGVSVLADVLMELADDSRIKRRLRYELLAAAGGDGLTLELGKRLDAMAKTDAFIDRSKLREFARDLDVLRRMITEKVAASNPAAALELMWRFLALAAPITLRVYEVDGVVGEVFRKGCGDLNRLMLAAKMPAGDLVKQVFGLIEEDERALFDSLISSTASALGPAGQQALRALLTSALRKRPAKRSVFYDPTANTLRHALMELADIAGDPDGYIATIPASERDIPLNGARIARRLLSAGRTEEALAALDASSPHRPRERAQTLRIMHPRDLRAPTAETWDDVHLDALDASGRSDEAQAQRWASFRSTLSIPRLKSYLKGLPDFDDVVAEEDAMALAAGFKPFRSALAFFIEWPKLSEAARLVIERRSEIHGDYDEILVPAARRLEGAYPVAATVLLRAIISYTLKNSVSSRYKPAARHLLECESLAGLLTSSAEISTHADFVAELRAQHGRKHGFKGEVEALGGVF